MIVIKEEAKKLWCPMVRMPGFTSACNRDDVKRNVSCIADKCMMWVWTEEFTVIEPCKEYGTCGLIQPHKYP